MSGIYVTARQLTEPDLGGVHWAGPGTEVQRADDEGLFPGDMEAAVHVARVTSCHWLVYSPQAEDRPWAVFAYVSPAVARAAADEAGEGAFWFDGREGIPPSHASGVGYAPPGRPSD